MVGIGIIIGAILFFVIVTAIALFLIRAVLEIVQGKKDKNAAGFLTAGEKLKR